MATAKTKPTSVPVKDFIDKLAITGQQRRDSVELLQIMEQLTGYPPKMWGASIIGFGSYHYQYDSGHEGDAPLVGFSPRKAAFSLYVFTGLEAHEPLLDGLGTFKRGKACIYVKKLSDIDLQVLSHLITTTVGYLKNKYPDK